MPLFLSDGEYERCSNDAALVAEKADAFIRDLYNKLETDKAQADAATITAEQTYSLLEQKYSSPSSEFAKLESQNAQLNSSLDQRLSELAQLQAEKHQLHLKSIGKDGEIERLMMEVSELHKSKRQSMELLEQKDLEISEKNTTIKSYLDKIVNLTDNAALREARLNDSGAELARSQAVCARLSQVERQFNECSSSLKWNKERVRELEMKLTALQEELCSSKDASATSEEQLSAQISTVNRLVELYEESSEEWSRKARELEGLIKALEETHLSQVENDYKERLEKEVSARKEFEKEATDLKEKLEKCEAEIEASRKANELNLLPLGSSTTDTWVDSFKTNDIVEDNCMLVPKIPFGVSGTALAASPLRDGWSLAKMYGKYQEAVDALRHEQLERKNSEAILQRVLCELEEKAEVILNERAEHERMVEAYSAINQKLQHSLSGQENMEKTIKKLQHSLSKRENMKKTIKELKADSRRLERDYIVAQKENADLQKQIASKVAKEHCAEQVRCHEEDLAKARNVTGKAKKIVPCPSPIPYSRRALSSCQPSNLSAPVIDDQTQTCPICLTKGKDLAFGCGHMTCRDCGSRLSNCPICRERITSCLRVYSG